jgi:hypothetical protein
MSDLPIDRRDGGGQYEIRVKGQLAARWETWFDGFTLSAADDGTSSLAGFIVDQAALHGVLRKLADLGLPLISVTSSPQGGSSTTPTTDHR